MKMNHSLILHSLLMLFEKNFSQKYSHILIFAVISYCVFFLSICVCSLSKLSQINAKIRNICEKNLSVHVVYANDTVLLRDVRLTEYSS